MAFETATLVELLDTDDLFGAVGVLDRVVTIAQILGEQIRVMFTLSPARFQVIRRSLGNGSGLESPGYNHMHAAADAAAGALGRLFGRRGASVIDAYRTPERFPDLHRIAERFVDWDSAFQSWLVEHFQLVRRTIGIDKTVRGLDGFPTVALGARMTKPLFPDLWSVRVDMTRQWSRDGGFAVGEARDAEAAPEPGEAPPRAQAAAPTPAVRIDAGQRAETEEVIPIALPDQIRAEFPLLATCTYLNSNATGATPRGAKAALDSYWQTIERWRDEAWDRWWVDLRAHADDLAALIGAPPGSVICDSSVSTLLARVLSCFDYRQRPRVVTSDLEFPAVPHVVGAFARYGAELVVVPSRDSVAIDVEGVVAALDERTQLVCLSHATFETGALVELEPIVRRARQVGALVALDAYQSVGVVPLDVVAADVDFVLGGAHKWLCGSYESAFLYVRSALVPALTPAATGWIATADPMSFGAPTGWADGIRRFAGGTPAVLPSLFSRPGLAIVRDLGVDTIRYLSLMRTDRVIARAEEARLPVATPRAHDQRGGIVALRFPGDDLVTRALVASGFICSHRSGLRIAPHFYNSEEEVDRFMDELVRRVREAT
jgi:selenocysteine lyase/cysteine desulfurase/tryptophan 2,3-dioxygenase